MYRSSYYGAWYNLVEVRERNAMCFFMRRAVNIPTLQYRNFMRFNMNQYGAVSSNGRNNVAILINKKRNCSSKTVCLISARF